MRLENPLLFVYVVIYFSLYFQENSFFKASFEVVALSGAAKISFVVFFEGFLKDYTDRIIRFALSICQQKLISVAMADSVGALV